MLRYIPVPALFLMCKVEPGLKAQPVCRARAGPRVLISCHISQSPRTAPKFHGPGTEGCSHLLFQATAQLLIYLFIYFLFGKG